MNYAFSSPNLFFSFSFSSVLCCFCGSPLQLLHPKCECISYLYILLSVTEQILIRLRPVVMKLSLSSSHSFQWYWPLFWKFLQGGVKWGKTFSIWSQRKWFLPECRPHSSMDSKICISSGCQLEEDEIDP